MRKAAVLVLVFALLVSIAGPAFAKNPGDKLIRGAANVCGCFLEIPQSIGEEWKASNNAAIGMFAGFFKGTALTMGRLFSGSWDLLTFPIAIPADYEPVVKPDFPSLKVE